MAKESYALQRVDQLQPTIQRVLHRRRPQSQLQLPVGHRYIAQLDLLYMKCFE